VKTSNTQIRELALSPTAVAEFFKPARLEIYESLQTSGPASIAELAERLGKAPDSLYYHVRKLVKIRVLEPLPDKTTGLGEPGRNGAIYGLTACSVTMKLDPRSRASCEAWGKGASGVMRVVTRDVEAALNSGEARVEGADRNLMVQRLKVRLKDRELKRVNKLVDELFTVLREHADNTEGQLYALTCAFSPLTERAR
jgi:DNA-binding transcriptional ArsR family regulator